MFWARVSAVLLVIATSLLDCVNSNKGNVICSVQEYVKVGMEFEECQKTALFNYSKGIDPCPMLKRVVDTCAYNVKVNHQVTLMKPWLKT